MTSIFQRIPDSNVTLVHTRDASVMLRLALLRPWMIAEVKAQAMVLARRLLPRVPIAGTARKGRKGWRIYICPSHMGDLTMDQVIAHESYHTLPIIGWCEIAAHFVGGLHRRPERFSWRYALHDVLMFAITRPIRLACELAFISTIITALTILIQWGRMFSQV
jgi:hypothetical protein